MYLVIGLSGDEARSYEAPEASHPVHGKRVDYVIHSSGLRCEMKIEKEYEKLQATRIGVSRDYYIQKSIFTTLGVCVGMCART